MPNSFTRYIAALLLSSLLIPGMVSATPPCTGRFVKPIGDVCWSCIFPISIGKMKLMNVGGRRDSDNPSNPLCVCMRNIGGVQVPVPGLAIGFWEPVRLIDVTRTPFCLVNMAGKKMPIGKTRRIGDVSKNFSTESTDSYSYYNVHYYVYPLLYWFEVITDMGCLEKDSFDVLYMSEFDPTWNDDSLSAILNPELFLFTSPPAHLACIADCTKATIDMPIDAMPWCAGCFGGTYPLGGRVEGHNNGVQASSLLAIRAIAKEHRLGLALETATDTGEWFNGPLCRKNYAPLIKKSQYKLQLLYPVPITKGQFGCVPLGMSDVLYNSMKEFPGGGEDFGYLLWRKKNCCFL